MFSRNKTPHLPGDSMCSKAAFDGTFLPGKHLRCNYKSQNFTQIEYCLKPYTYAEVNSAFQCSTIRSLFTLKYKYFRQ